MTSWREKLSQRWPHTRVVVLLTIALAGVVARVFLAWVSRGSNDIDTWRGFGNHVDKYGLVNTYKMLSDFNHPPIMGYFVEAAVRVASYTGLPFPFVFKIPSMLSDVGVLVLLWSIWRRRDGTVSAAKASALFAWSLCAILVGAYHGNTDSVCAFLCLLCLYFATEKHRYFAAGLAFGAAVNVKLIPLVAVPAILLTFKSWRALWQFVAAAAVGILPFLPILWYCGRAFEQNAIAYNSNFDNWGIPFFIRQSEANRYFGAAMLDFAPWYVAHGRYLVIGGAVILPLWLRLQGKTNRYRLFAVAMAMFLVLAPGFGVQYVVYLAPVAFAVDMKWGALYSTTAGLFIGLIYLSFLDKTKPLHSTFVTAYPMPGTLIGMLAWLLIIHFAWTSLADMPHSRTLRG